MQKKNIANFSSALFVGHAPAGATPVINAGWYSTHTKKAAVRATRAEEARTSWTRTAEIILH